MALYPSLQTFACIIRTSRMLIAVAVTTQTVKININNRMQQWAEEAHAHETNRK